MVVEVVWRKSHDGRVQGVRVRGGKVDGGG